MTFTPNEINQGSSSWWVYGEDNRNYYYFTYRDDIPYIYTSKENNCKGFNKTDFSTWCEAHNGLAK